MRMDEIISEVREFGDTVLSLGRGQNDLLSRIAKKQYSQFHTNKYFHIAGTGKVGGSSTEIEFDVESVPVSSLWEIRRFALTGKDQGQFALYLNEVKPYSLIGFVDNTGIVTGSFDNCIIVPGGNKVIPRFYNQANNQEVSYRLEIRQFAENVGWNERELSD